MRRFYFRNDRRRFQRLKVNLSVFYKVESPAYASSLTEDSEVEATILDISKGGLAFLTKYNIPAWAILSIRFYLFKADDTGMVSFNDPFEATAEVRSNYALENGQYRLGVVFKDIAVKDREGIGDFVAASTR